MTLDEARVKCRDDRAKAQRGEDPRSDNPVRSDSFQGCVETYIKHEQIGSKESVTAQEVRRVILKACADWHGRPIATIRPQEIQHLLWQIRDGDPSKGIRPKRALANKVFTNLKPFLAWCAKPAIGKLKVSPMLGIDKPWQGEQPRDRWFTDGELKKLWTCALDPIESAYLKLLILSGKRKNALAAMKWGDISDNWVWEPGGGNSQKRQHDLPLPKLAQRILLGLKPRDAQPDHFVFPSEKGPTSHKYFGDKFAKRVEKLSGIEDVYPHACRHTVETKLAKLKVEPHIRDLYLDHAPNRGSGKGYDHYKYEPQLRETAELWANYIEKLVMPEGVKALR
jgi:integrase